MTVEVRILINGDERIGTKMTEPTTSPTLLMFEARCGSSENRTGQNFEVPFSRKKLEFMVSANTSILLAIFNFFIMFKYQRPTIRSRLAVGDQKTRVAKT